MNSTLLLIKAEPTVTRQIFWYMFGLVLPAICLFGVITNLMSIIVLSNSRLKENCYIYMLAYSYSDFFYTFFVFFTWVSRSNLPIAYTYLAKWYEIYVFFPALNGLGTLSGLIEIAISFDRLFLVKKTCLSSRKISPHLVNALLFIVSALTASVYSVPRSIKEVETEYYDPKLNTTYIEKTFAIYFNDFGTSLDGRILYVVVTVIKNIGTIILLVIVNAYLYVELRKYYRKKSKLLKKSKLSHISPTGNSSKRDETSEIGTGSQVGSKLPPRNKLSTEERSHMQKYIQMTVYMFVLYTIGNLMNGVIGVCFIYYSRLVSFQMLLTFGDVPQFLCRGLNIFIYYRFNVRFKNILDGYINKAWSALRCCFCMDDDDEE